MMKKSQNSMNLPPVTLQFVKLICAFVFSYANCLFPHDTAHIFFILQMSEAGPSTSGSSSGAADKKTDRLNRLKELQLRMVSSTSILVVT